MTGRADAARAVRVLVPPGRADAARAVRVLGPPGAANAGDLATHRIIGRVFALAALAAVVGRARAEARNIAGPLNDTLGKTVNRYAYIPLGYIIRADCGYLRVVVLKSPLG